MGIMYDPRANDEHVAPYAHSIINLASHSEDAGGLVRDIIERDDLHRPYLCQRPGFTERDNPLAE